MSAQENRNGEAAEHPPPPRPILVLTSHAHANKLRPRPDLKYDCRSMPNPPKGLRTTHTGVSKRVREHMLSDGQFVSTLGRAEVEVRIAMQEAVRQWPAQQQLARVETNDEQPGAAAAGAQKQGGEGDQWEDVVEDDGAGDDDDGFEDVESEDGDSFTGSGGDEEDEEEDEPRPTLTIGAYCYRGRHRSVAFVEELARRDWPEGWSIRIDHRDVNSSGGEKKTRKDARWAKYAQAEDAS